MVGFNRAAQRKDLKARRKQLMMELGITKRLLRGKLPRVHGKGRNFEVDEKRQGRKMSLVQQVVWLEELAEATKEIREEMMTQGIKNEGESTVTEEEPAFKVID